MKGYLVAMSLLGKDKVRYRYGRLIQLKYTVLTLLLTLIFAVGSMAGMHLVLRVREQQLLSQQGKVAVESPVRAWQKEEDAASGQELYLLTIEQMQEVISTWDEHLAVTVHSPVNGQLPMETAIEAGKEWLVQMGFGAAADVDVPEVYSVKASLSIVNQNQSAGAQAEPYYSFWVLRFVNQSMMAFLRLNAVTGTVWSADITLYEDVPEDISCEKLKRFVELSGLSVPETDMNVITENAGRTNAVLKIADSRLQAEMAFWRSRTEYVYSVNEGNGLVEYQENVRILLQYTVSSSQPEQGWELAE